MIVRHFQDIDILYALFLGRMPENNFVRDYNVGRDISRVVKGMIECDEFAHSVIERFSLHGALPHDDLPSSLLPDVVALIAEARLAPPEEGASVARWRELLGRVLAAPDCRQLIEGKFGVAGLKVIAGLHPGDHQTEGAVLDQAITERTIVSGADLIANSICRGWIVDRDDPGAMLHLRVKINGLTVKILAANEFRPDVQEAFGGQGRAGFTIRLDQLPETAFLSRGAIEVIELNSGATVVPEQIVEFRATPARCVEAELHEALQQLREYMNSCGTTIPPTPSAAGRVVRLQRAACYLEVPSADSAPGQMPEEQILQLIELLGRVEESLPDLRNSESWSLPFYGGVRSFYDLVLPPPSAAGTGKRFRPMRSIFSLGTRRTPTGISVVILPQSVEAGAIDATIASIGAQTCKPQEVYLITSSKADLELVAGNDVKVIELKLGQTASAAVNETSSRLSGTSILAIESGSTLAPAALAWFQAAFNCSSASILYSDGEMLEASLSHGRRLLPVFRPAFDYDMLLQRNYVGTTFCIARNHFAELQGLQTDEAVDPWHDLLLRACERFGRGAIMHLPQILIRSPENIGAVDPTVARDRTLITVQRHLERTATGAAAVPHHDPLGRSLDDAVNIVWADNLESRIAAIIPTRNSVDMVFAHVSSLRRHARKWDRVEIVVIVNGETDDRTRIGFSEIERTFDNLRVVYRPAPFNWAEINNAAVSEVAAGSILLFLNDDMVCLTAGWDVRLRSQLGRRDVGVVGGRLLYPNGAIQHAGIAFGAAGKSQHEAMGDMAGDGLYLDRTLLVHDAGAVTGALFACRRTTFEAIGCFDAKRYKVTSSDADLCVRVRAAGDRVLYDPVLTWIHYESVSRGADSNDDKKRWRAEAEHAAFTSHFSEVDLLDLSVNPHLFRSGRPFEVFQRLGRNTLDLWLHAQVLRRERWSRSTGSTPSPASG